MSNPDEVPLSAKQAKANAKGAKAQAKSTAHCHSYPPITLKIYAHLFSKDQEIVGISIGNKFVGLSV